MGGRLVEVLVTCLLSFIIGTISFAVFVYGLIRHGSKEWLFVKKRNERPKILESDEYGSHHWVPLKRTRLKLHVVVSGPKDKPLMLFLHGFPEFWYSWRHQLKEFSKDYRTAAVDMRGYGDSDKPSGVSEYTLDKLIDDIDQLTEQLGHRRFVLVGHDWGAAVAWHYAETHRERVDRLVICNCPHPVAFQNFILTSYEQLAKSWYMFLFQVPVLPILLMRALDLRRIAAAFCGRAMGARQGTFTAEDIEAYKYTFAEYSDLCGPINYYRAALRQGLMVTSQPKLSMPTLMIWGTRDGALDRRLADLSGAHVDDYTVRYVGGASHWVQQEEPEQVNRHIRDFIKGKLKEPESDG